VRLSQPGLFDESVSITTLKRFVTERAKDEESLPQVEPKEEKIVLLAPVWQAQWHLTLT